MKKEFLEIGKIVGTHGVRGMVRIQPWSDNGDFLTQFKKFYLENGKEKLDLSKITPHGGIDPVTRLERTVYLGDDRNIAAKFVAGERIL